MRMFILLIASVCIGCATDPVAVPKPQTADSTAQSDGFFNLHVTNLFLDGSVKTLAVFENAVSVGDALVVVGDVYTTQLTNYASTLTGLGAPNYSYVSYKKVGKTVAVSFEISTDVGGGSAVSFSIPFGRSSVYATDPTFTYFAAGTTSQISYGSVNSYGIVSLIYNAVGSDWSGSTRQVKGSFNFETD